MNEWLRGKAFGMPRWAWLAILAAALAVALYLRYRSAQQAQDEATSGDGQLDPSTGLPIDPSTGLPYDPATGTLYDPDTGLPLSSSLTDPSLAGLGVFPPSGAAGGTTDSAGQAALLGLLGIILRRILPRPRPRPSHHKPPPGRRHHEHHHHPGGHGHRGDGRHHQGGPSRRGGGRTIRNTPTGGGPPGIGTFRMLPAELRR